MHGTGLDAEASSDLKEGTEWACSKVDDLSTTISNTIATIKHHQHQTASPPSSLPLPNVYLTRCRGLEQ